MTTGFYLAAIVGTVLSFIAGCVWYTAITGKAWQEEMGFSDEKLRQIFTPKRMILAFICEWIVAFCTIGIFFNLPVDWIYKLLMVTAVVVFQGIKLSIFDGKSFNVIAINEGYRIISIVILGIAFTVFM